MQLWTASPTGSSPAARRPDVPISTAWPPPARKARRAHLSCSGQAHAYAASGDDKSRLARDTAGNLAIVTTYNDMLSAHQPFETYPEMIRDAARAAGGTAQVAGGSWVAPPALVTAGKWSEIEILARNAANQG